MASKQAKSHNHPPYMDSCCVCNAPASVDIEEVLFFCFSDDFNRVVLNKIQGVEGSDYINASYVDVRACAFMYSTHLYTCIYVHTYTHIHIHIHLYTHSQTHTKRDINSVPGPPWHKMMEKFSSLL